MLNMKLLIPALAFTVILAGPASAIPQNFGGGGGGFFGANFTPRDIENDLTDELIAALGARGAKLPQEWKVIPSMQGEDVKLLTVRPIIFGERPTAVFANSTGSDLRSISVLYLDAGHFFGYRASGSESKDELRDRQREFKKRYSELEDDLGKTLSKFTKSAPRTSRVGRSAFLSTVYSDFKYGDLTLRFAAINGYSVSVTIVRSAEANYDYLDKDIAELDKRDRRKLLLDNVEKRDGGDTLIKGIPMFQQGLRPYCAISTLGMATHYLGLRMGTDALAAGARFKNTGSAKGAMILDLYRAAADESDATLQRGGKFDLRRAQGYIEKGFPIVVWRRYSDARDKLHAAAARGAELPAADATDRASWPTGKDAPGHASVITGVNAETGEVIFDESWGEHARGKRMRAEELEATSYAVFYFKI